MKKIKNIILIIVIMIFFISLGFLLSSKTIDYNHLKGDSGFDTSYDSSSSSSDSSSSSSWDSGSSYDSGSSWGSGDSSISSGGTTVISGIFFVIVFVPIIIIGTIAIIAGFINYFKEHGLKVLINYAVILGVMVLLFFASILLFNIEGDLSIIGIIPFILIVFVPIIYIKIKDSYYQKIYYAKEKKMEEEIISKYNLDYEELKNEFYKIYIDVQNAWMNFDYDILRNNLTDELYNQYEMQLKSLEVKKEKNIMSDFILEDFNIDYLDDKNGKLTISTKMKINFYDYIVDDNNNCIRGNNKKKVTQYYMMYFVKSIDKKVNKCPNCGAELDNAASQKCEHCGSVVSTLSNKWVLSKKQSLSQR